MEEKRREETRYQLTKSPLATIERKQRQLTLSSHAAPGLAEVIRAVALLPDCVGFDLCVSSQPRLTFTSACG